MNTFGRHFRVALAGESHGPAIVLTVDGVPAGIPFEVEFLQAELAKRRPGQDLTTGRKETDEAEVLSGVLDGWTTGAPIAILWRNDDVKATSEDRHDVPRPGHADYALSEATRAFADLRGGGHASGRLTVALVAAGAIAQMLLDGFAIRTGAHLHGVAGLHGPEGVSVDAMEKAKGPLWTAHTKRAADFRRLIEGARSAGDSVGGTIAFSAEGVPVGLGDPFFDGLDATLGHLLFSIPAVKAVEFGHGVAAAGMRGSTHNDALVADKAGTHPATNHAGGLLGGRSSGLPITGRVTVKPAASIAATQRTLSRSKRKTVNLDIRSRNDPCIALRAVAVVRGALRVALADAVLAGCAQGVVAPWWADNVKPHGRPDP